jgi:hypothetical protein
MTYRRIYVDSATGEYVVLESGTEVERRPATEQERTVLPPAPPDPSETVRTTLQQQAAAAMEANRTWLAVAAPTNAQTLAQVRALTRQMNGAIRLLLNQLDGTD